MTPAQLFLDGSRRLIVRLITIGLSALALVFTVIVVTLLVIAPMPGLLAFLVVLIIFLTGCGMTMATLKSWPLRQTVLPVTIGLFIILSVSGLLLPELAQPAAPFLAFNVLLVSLGGNKRLTLIIAGVSTLTAVTIVSNLPRPFQTLSMGATAAEAITVLGAGTFVLVFWLVCSRFMSSQNTALAMADQRANEAELARAEAEAAHAEVGRQSAEQMRLLDLVRTLELPVLSVGAGLLLVPLVGNLDRQRVMAIRDQLLRKVAEHQAHTVVLDVTGITLIDTVVAHALLQTAHGIHLLGARTLMSGIRAEVAQTLANLEIDLTELQPVGNLRQAIEAAKQGDREIGRQGDRENGVRRQEYKILG